MTDQHFAAANRGLPCPAGCPPEPYRIMRVTYAAFRAGRIEAVTGRTIHEFIGRWDELPDREKRALSIFADAFDTPPREGMKSEE